MSFYIVDWDGRLIHVVRYRVPGDFPDFDLTGPISRARRIENPDSTIRKLSISSAVLGPETVLDNPDTLCHNWYYIPPDECRIRAEQGYQTSKFSISAEIDELAYEFLDLLSLGSILNGMVI